MTYAELVGMLIDNRRDDTKGADYGLDEYQFFVRGLDGKYLRQLW